MFELPPTSEKNIATNPNGAFLAAFGFEFASFGCIKFFPVQMGPYENSGQFSSEQSHIIHVWCIYLHFPLNGAIFHITYIAKYTIHGSCGNHTVDRTDSWRIIPESLKACLWLCAKPSAFNSSHDGNFGGARPSFVMSNFFQFEVHFSFAPVKVLGLVEVTTNDKVNASDACQFPNVIYDIFFHHQLVEALNPLQMRRTFLGIFGCLGIHRIPNLHPCEFTLWFHVISAIQKTHWKPTPWKINMEPANHRFRKENDLPNPYDYVPC